MAEKWVCSIVPLLFTAHLMLPGVLGEECAPVNHDIKDLKERDYWEFEIQGQGVPWCPQYEIEGKNTSCIFYFSICKEVPEYCPARSGICLANKVSPDKTNITLYTRFINIGTSSDDFTSEQEEFTLTFPPSDLGNKTVFKFQCNNTAEWKKLEDGKVNQYLVNTTYLNSTKGEIEYNFVFNYSGACRRGGGGGDEGPKDVLSVGSILLIVFFPGIFLYCVVGALINKGSGKTGKDMIPNAEFWSNLPGLISDGFSFVISKITCSEMSTTQERYDRM
ncbi:hypothetical protein ABFA07_001530 [Porites harrisoni]